MGNGPFIDGLPIKNGDFPWLCNKLPEGIYIECRYDGRDLARTASMARPPPSTGSMCSCAGVTTIPTTLGVQIFQHPPEGPNLQQPWTFQNDNMSGFSRYSLCYDV